MAIFLLQHLGWRRGWAKDALMSAPNLSPAETSAIIEMALSDHVAFADIEAQFGLSDKQVKTLMRDNLKPSSYRTWRKRVRDFGDRREHYK